MSIKFSEGLDLQHFQLLHVVLENLAAAPSSPAEGWLYYDTVLHQFGYYNGSAWVYGTTVTLSSPGGTITVGGTGANPTIDVAKVLDHTWITDFDTQVRNSRLDQMAAPTADVSLATHKLTNVVDPTNPQEVATKSYVDSVAQGITQKHVAVALRDTNLAALTGLPTIDGVTLTDGQIAFLTAQTTASQNGLWAVHAGAWTRPTFFPVGGDAAGSYVFVEQGTVYKSSGWVIQGGSPIVIDTTAQTWTQFSGAGEITVVGLITKTGNQIGIAWKGFASGLVGNGAATDIDFAHNLGLTTKDLCIVQVIDQTTFDMEITRWTAKDVNTVTVHFGAAPAANAKRVNVTAVC